jgi:hypothetical protein
MLPSSKSLTGVPRPLTPRDAGRRVHVPGNDRREGRGIFYHRASNPHQERTPDRFEGPPYRRFDARRLPTGITQVVGHTADEKCRNMLGDWADSAPATPGILRHLRTDGRKEVKYVHGTPAEEEAKSATMIFIDGLMAKVPPEKYELFDLTTRRSYRRS